MNANEAIAEVNQLFFENFLKLQFKSWFKMLNEAVTDLHNGYMIADKKSIESALLHLANVINDITYSDTPQANHAQIQLSINITEDGKFLIS